MIVEERAAGLADPQRAVPLGDRLEVRRRRGGRRSRAMPAGSSLASSTTNPARQFSAPQIPNATVNRSPRSIGSIARAQQPERRARPGRQHQMARQRRAVPVEQPDRLALGHPRPEAEQQPAHAVRRLAGRVFERGELVDLVDDAQAVGGVDEQVGRVLDQRRPRPVSRRSSSTMYDGTSIEPRSAYVFQPTTPTRLPGPIPSSPRISRERPRPVARLAGQAEVLEQVRGASAAVPRRPSRSTRCRRGSPGRRSGPTTSDRLLEARVEAGQPGEVRAVLAVGVDDQPVVAARRRSRSRSASSRAAYSDGGQLRARRRASRSRAGRSWARRALDVRRRHGALLLRVAATAGSRSRRARSIDELVGRRVEPRPDGRRRATGRAPRRASAGPSPKWTQPSWPPAWPPPTVSSRRSVVSPTLTSIQAPIASRFGPGWVSRSAEPVARPAPDAAAPPSTPTFRQTRTGVVVEDLDEVGQAVEVEVGQGRTAAARVVEDAGRLGDLDERAVRLAEEEVATGRGSRSPACWSTLPFETNRSMKPSLLTSWNSGCQAVDGSGSPPVDGRVADDAALERRGRDTSAATGRRAGSGGRSRPGSSGTTSG